MNPKLTASLTAAVLALGTYALISSHADEPAPPKEGAAPAPQEKDRPDAKAAPDSTPPAAAEGRKQPAQDPALGAITGRLVLEGDPPQLKAIEVPASNKDHATCSAHVKDERVVLSKEKQVKNAVVAIANYKQEARPEPREITLDNKNCTFIPHIQATTVGSSLKVTSSDPFLHNTHLFFDFNANFAVTKGDPVVKKLPKEGKVLVQCDFHPWMQAWIRIFAHDLFDTSAADGTYKLVNVPPGEHEIEVWHEVLETPKQKVKVEAGKTVTVDFALRARKKSGS